MIKKDISKSLKEGSLKQRQKLLAEVLAAQSIGEDLLTDKEMEELSNSFKTNEEIRAYNKALANERAMRHALLTLFQFRNNLAENIAWISGYVNLWYSHEETEELINEMLFAVKNPGLKKKLIGIATKKKPLLFATLKENEEEEGFITVITDQPRNPKLGDDASLEGIIHIYKARAERILSQLKGMLLAMDDWMANCGYTAKRYKESINAIKADINKDHSAIPRFSKRKMIELFKDDEQSEGLRRCWVYPDPDSIEPDMVFYKRFKESTLTD